MENCCFLFLLSFWFGFVLLLFCEKDWRGEREKEKEHKAEVVGRPEMVLGGARGGETWLKYIA